MNVIHKNSNSNIYSNIYNILFIFMIKAYNSLILILKSNNNNAKGKESIRNITVYKLCELSLSLLRNNHISL